MVVRSLGFRTDLMMITLRGGSIIRHADHRVIRLADNPLFRGGNFLLLDTPRAPGTLRYWEARFRAEFRTARYLLIGIDSPDPTDADTAYLTKANLALRQYTVLTATAAHPSPDVELRMLDGDLDWAAVLQMSIDTNTAADPGEFRAACQLKLRAMRRLQQAGRGAWFAAFVDGCSVAALGIYSDGSGYARYQNVSTHPEHRRQGLAGTLVHRAGGYALRELGARALVIVADPDKPAIRLYRSLGFTDTETQTELERLPCPAEPATRSG
jgi:ribosomal protein S18 acetylase RimI-like enzyme